MKLIFNLTYNYTYIIKMGWCRDCLKCKYFRWVGEGPASTGSRECSHPVKAEISGYMVCYNADSELLYHRYIGNFESKEMCKKL
jgi:hypothetical protein